MAGMKRFVTYIYSYDNEKKGGNAGFARIEIRGNECRIEIHLRGLYIGHMTCKVYLFRPEGEDIIGFPIGELTIQKGLGDFGTIIKAGQIGASPFGMSDMEGIFLIGDENRIFMSRWREGVPLKVCGEHFTEWRAEPDKEKNSMHRESGAQEAVPKKGQQGETETPQRNAVYGPAAGQRNGAVQKTAAGPRNGAAEETETVQKNGADQKTAVVQRNGAIEETETAQGNDKAQEPAAGQRNGVVQKTAAGQRNGAIEEIETAQGSDKAQEPTAGQRSEADQKTAAGQRNGAIEETETAQGNVKAQATAVFRGNSEVRKTGTIQERPVMQETQTMRGRPAAQQKEAAENVAATEIPMKNIFPQYTWEEIWENLKGAHPTFAPFENENITCVRIEIKDIRELPKRYWYFGNNSFLLHGFFNYHYIVIGKMEKERWFIGVPGIYQRQERVMAAIFGFPEFIPTALPEEVKNDRGKYRENVENQREFSNQEEPINRFGYWFRYIEET